MDATPGLDPQQAAAASAPGGRAMIAAGAGTGKTTTLAARIAHLIGAAGIPPSGIVAVTFTNKAARELRARVEARLGRAADGLRVGTFHSLSCRILRRHAPAAGLRDGGFAIVDEDDALTLMERAAQIPGAHGPFEPTCGPEDEARRKAWQAALREFSRRALAQVSQWKAWGLTADEADRADRPPRDPSEERMAAAYVAYQFELESRNSADFGDLILKVVRLLSTNAGLLSEESSRIRHLLVDEGQDANPVQVEWVRLLASWSGCLTVVGDEDQSIFGFQGGYPAAMRDMVGPTAAMFALTTNRRCTKEILRPANLAVEYNRRSSPKVLVSDRSGATVRTTAHSTEAQEATWVAKRIAEFVAQGSPPGEIAVLFRTTYIIPPFEEALARVRVPAVVVSGSSLLAREESKDVLAYLRLAANPYDDLAFRRIANRPLRGIGPASVEALCSLSAGGAPFHDLCREALGRDGRRMRKETREGVASLGRALMLLAEDGRWSRSARDAVETALGPTGYLRFMETSEGSIARLATIDALRRLSEPFEDVQTFLQEMALVAGDEVEPGNRVRLSTMHAAKGLEFDHVFCVGFDAGTMPSARALEDGGRGRAGDTWNGPCGGGIEEERRLAHVAFTRPRKTLDVTFPWRRGRKSGGKGSGPSVLIEECELAFSEAERASTGELGRVRSSRRSGRVGFDR